MRSASSHLTRSGRATGPAMAPGPKGHTAGPFVLALDIGSTAVRARLYDGLARAVPGATGESRRAPSPRGIEDPAALEASVEDAIGGALAAAESMGVEIAAVATATFVGNVMGVDDAGVPATPLYTYAHAAPAAEVAELRSALEADELYQRTGCPLHTSYQAPRLLWLRRNQPEAFARTRRWVDFGTYLYSKWFARADVSTSYSVASWSGMLDRRLLRWDRPLLDYLQLPVEALPPLADFDRPQRGLAARWARRWPALSGVPFYLAVGDGAAANIGAGCGPRGPRALTVGTTAALRSMLEGAPVRVPSGLWAYRLDRRRSLVGGAITDAGSLLAWLDSTLRLAGDRVTEAEVAAIEPDGHGLTVLPFLRGERSPGWASDATATWHGIRASTTPAEMIRAALEAVAYRLCLISHLIDGATGASGEVIAGGGAVLRLPSWMQIIADTLGKTVIVSGEPGTTLRGVAILALEALGAIGSLAPLQAGRGRRYEPNAEASERYHQGLERHIRLYDMLVARRSRRSDLI